MRCDNGLSRQQKTAKDLSLSLEERSRLYYKLIKYNVLPQTVSRREDSGRWKVMFEIVGALNQPEISAHWVKALGKNLLPHRVHLLPLLPSVLYDQDKELEAKFDALFFGSLPPDLSMWSEKLPEVLDFFFNLVPEYPTPMQRKIIRKWADQMGVMMERHSIPTSLCDPHHPRTSRIRRNYLRMCAYASHTQKMLLTGTTKMFPLALELNDTITAIQLLSSVSDTVNTDHAKAHQLDRYGSNLQRWLSTTGLFLTTATISLSGPRFLPFPLSTRLFCRRYKQQGTGNADNLSC